MISFQLGHRCFGGTCLVHRKTAFKGGLGYVDPFVSTMFPCLNFNLIIYHVHSVLCKVRFRVTTPCLTRKTSKCIAELQHKALALRQTGTVSCLDVDASVVKSDTAISEDLRAALLRACAPLEDVPDDVKNWHPGSYGTVLDLVHPSHLEWSTGDQWSFLTDV